MKNESGCDLIGLLFIVLSPSCVLCSYSCFCISYRKEADLIDLYMFFFSVEKDNEKKRVCVV